MKTPRIGTRVRAVFDELQDGNEHRWSELASVYAHAYAPYSNMTYVGLTLSRILKKYATRLRRGVYVKKTAPIVPNPFANKVLGAPFQVGDKVICTDAGENNHIETGERYVIKRITNETYSPSGWLVEVVSKTHGIVGVFSSRFKLTDDKSQPKTEVLRHGGREPKMDDRCGTCGQTYGNHYGQTWPAPTDCPVIECGGFIRRSHEHETKRYWTSKDVQPLPPFDNAFIGKGSPEIEDMAWSHKFDAAYDAKVEHETEVALLEARIEELERTKWKRLEPHGYPVCTCGEHTWPQNLKDQPEILANVRKMLTSEEGYGAGHYSDRICQSTPVFPDSNYRVVLELKKKNQECQEKIADLQMVVDNKNTYINQIEAKLTEVAERSHNRQKLIDETKDENLLYQTRLENGKTAVDNARTMLADILVGSLNEAGRALEDLDAQLCGTYGTLDGTMDE